MPVPGTVKLSYLATKSTSERLRRQIRYFTAVLKQTDTTHSIDSKVIGPGRF